MAYKIDLSGRLGDSVADAVCGEVESALEKLENDLADDPVTTVHGARKNLKKARSALRLMRPAMRRADARREQVALRDAGRLMSGARDADVRYATLCALTERLDGVIASRSLRALERRMEPDHSDRTGEMRIDEVQLMLGQVLEHARSWPVEDVDARCVAEALAARYGRGRGEMAAARKDPEPEALHEWRKRVKDLWYHHRLLTPAWPEVFEPVGEAAHKLSEHLGDDHDLWVLRLALTEPGGPLSRLRTDFTPLLDELDARRAELQRDSFALGARLFADPPDGVRERIGAVLSAAYRYAAQEPAAA